MDKRLPYLGGIHNAIAWLRNNAKREDECTSRTHYEIIRTRRCTKSEACTPAENLFEAGVQPRILYTLRVLN